MYTAWVLADGIPSVVKNSVIRKGQCTEVTTGSGASWVSGFEAKHAMNISCFPHIKNECFHMRNSSQLC